MAKSKKQSGQSMPRGKSGSEGNEVACAVLSYLLVGIIWFFADENMRKSAFVKRHASQGLVILVLSVAASIVLSILSAILVWIPVVGWMLINIIWVAVELCIFILWIMGVIHAATGKDEKMPFVGEYAEKLKF